MSTTNWHSIEPVIINRKCRHSVFVPSGNDEDSNPACSICRSLAGVPEVVHGKKKQKQAAKTE
jgi:hypothetical protein